MKRPTWKLTLGKPDRYGRKQVRTIHLTVDVLDYRGQAGFALLLMAANPELSNRDIEAVLAELGGKDERPLSWISRRRWLFRGKYPAGTKPNADGKDEQAREFIAANSHESSRQLAYMLRVKLGIRRSPPWVQRNRT